MSIATEQPAQPRRWRLLTPRRVIVAIVLLLVAAPLGYRAIELLSTPDVGEPFDLEAFRAYTLPDEKNAFTHYRKVVALLVSEQNVLDANPSIQPKDFWDSETAAEEEWARAIPAVRQWVALNRSALDEWKRGADCEESLQLSPDQVATTGPLDGDVISLRNCSRLEGLEAMRLLSEGHPAEAWECCRNLLRASRHLSMHATLMGSLIAGAVVDFGVRGGVIWSSHKNVDAALLRRAIRDVEAVDRIETPPSDAIKLEYIGLRLFATKGIIGGTEIPAWLRYSGYPAQVGRTARLVVANLLTQADRPRYLRTAVHPGKLALFELDPSGTADPNLRPPEEIERSAVTSAPFVEKVLQRVVPVPALEIGACDPQMMNGSLHYAIQVNDTSQTRRSALLLALALELHYREHREFPASLDELVKNGYLKSIPIDPFGKGEPFRYRRETGQRPAAVVWSVWLDGIDQGGFDVPANNKDWGLRVVAPDASAASATQ